MSKTKKNIKQEALSKEKDVHELAEKLEKAGYEVRREKLKQGAGWKTVSGVCSVEGVPQTVLSKVGNLKSDIPDFRPGDTVKVHARIVEGNKERIQVFQGLVIRRRGRNSPNATFTVRKISYNVGVERTFLVHSPRIERIEVVARGVIRRAKLFYLRDTKGKAGRVRTRLMSAEEAMAANPEAAAPESPAETESAPAEAQPQ